MLTIFRLLVKDRKHKSVVRHVWRLHKVTESRSSTSFDDEQPTLNYLGFLLAEQITQHRREQDFYDTLMAVDSRAVTRCVLVDIWGSRYIGCNRSIFSRRVYGFRNWSRPEQSIYGWRWTWMER